VAPVGNVPHIPRYIIPNVVKVLRTLCRAINPGANFRADGPGRRDCTVGVVLHVALTKDETRMNRVPWGHLVDRVLQR
jgi:hypothetical protein